MWKSRTTTVIKHKPRPCHTLRAMMRIMFQKIIGQYRLRAITISLLPKVYKLLFLSQNMCNVQKLEQEMINSDFLKVSKLFYFCPKICAVKNIQCHRSPSIPLLLFPYTIPFFTCFFLVQNVFRIMKIIFPIFFLNGWKVQKMLRITKKSCYEKILIINFSSKIF